MTGEAHRFAPKNPGESGVSAAQARKRALRGDAESVGHEKRPLALWPYRFASNPFWGIEEADNAQGD